MLFTFPNLNINLIISLKSVYEKDFKQKEPQQSYAAFHIRNYVKLYLDFILFPGHYKTAVNRKLLG